MYVCEKSHTQAPQRGKVGYPGILHCVDSGLGATFFK